MKDIRAETRFQSDAPGYLFQKEEFEPDSCIGGGARREDYVPGEQMLETFAAFSEQKRRCAHSTEKEAAGLG